MIDHRTRGRIRSSRRVTAFETVVLASPNSSAAYWPSRPQLPKRRRLGGAARLNRVAGTIRRRERGRRLPRKCSFWYYK
jgi:hypothetical protein